MAEELHPYSEIQTHVVDHVKMLNADPTARHFTGLLGLINGLHISDSQTQEQISGSFRYSQSGDKRYPTHTHRALLWGDSTGSRNEVSVVSDGMTTDIKVTPIIARTLPGGFYEKPAYTDAFKYSVGITFDHSGRFMVGTVDLGASEYVAVKSDATLLTQRNFNDLPPGFTINFASLFDYFSTPSNWDKQNIGELRASVRDLIVRKS